MSNILTVKNLSVALDDQEILKDIDFDLAKGEHLSIIGPNGSGKTVLLKTLLGMYPHAGEIKWAPEAKIGYVPQKIDADRHLPLTIVNLLQAKARIKNIPAAEIESVTKTLSLTPKVLETPLGHLSGGQFQKTLIAYALLGKPNVILFDEPTASLDQLAEEHIYELIHELQDRYGITIVLVSHDLSVIYRYATRVLCLNKEKICYGSPEEVMKPEVLNRLFGAPHKYFHHMHKHDTE